jgi:curved DNA-binding protein CbpA
MANPYEVLGVSPEADDDTIRRRYLELVRQFSPEHHPERFKAVREAYENLRDIYTRLRFRLFEAGNNESIDGIIEELACSSPRRRLSTETILSLAKAP